MCKFHVVEDCIKTIRTAFDMFVFFLSLSLSIVYILINIYIYIFIVVWHLVKQCRPETIIVPPAHISKSHVAALDPGHPDQSVGPDQT